MEALHLPEELIWNGKMEPSSPSSELFSFSNSEESSWLLENNFAKDDLLLDDTVGEFLDDSLTDGELLCEFEYDVKQEQWIDGKSGMPICMDYSSGTISPNPVPIMKVQNPYEIIMELEKFYDGADLTQLTPPQTPPQESISSNDNYDICNHNTDIMMSSSNSSGLDSINSSTTSDMAIQIVDEILRNRAKDLPDWDYADDDSMYSTTSSSGVSQSTDENCFPSSAFKVGQSKKSSTGNVCKKTTRTYGRGLEEKKSRKKEQNKNAATRYRQKKKEEMKEAVDEEQKLLKVHHELLKSAAEYKHEIKYLKRLIKEFYKNDKK